MLSFLKKRPSKYAEFLRGKSRSAFEKYQKEVLHGKTKQRKRNRITWWNPEKSAPEKRYVSRTQILYQKSARKIF